MPWKPGTSGNPSGSRGDAIIRQQLMRACVQEDFRRVRAGIEKVLDMCAAGDPWAIGFVADRLDGKPRQATEVSGPDGGSIQVVVPQTITREEWLRIHGLHGGQSLIATPQVSEIKLSAADRPEGDTDAEC